MNYTVRAAHPSQPQIEALLEFLEREPTLAKSFPRLPYLRNASKKKWGNLTLELNRINGSVKTEKQWIKYWNDKKSAVRKKEALRLRTRNMTGDGAEVVELSDIEERILALMASESSATGVRHRETDPFEDIDDHGNSSPSASNSSSLLAKRLLSDDATSQSITAKSTPSPNFIELSNTNLCSAETQPQPQQFVECIPVTINLSTWPNEIRTVFENPEPKAEAPHCTPPRVDATASPKMSTSPSPSGRHPQKHGSLSSKPLHSATSSRRSRRWRPMSPPSQRQSHLSGIIERFVRMEEQRTEIQLQNSRIMESYLKNVVERDRSIAQALQAIGDGLKLFAEALNK